MKKKIADKWIAALNSGDYKQGKWRLKTDDANFCCLGVLCDLAVKEGIAKEVVTFYNGNKKISGYFSKKQAEGKTAFPMFHEIEDGIVKWSGMKSSRGEIKGTDKSLTNFNDSEGKTFTEIAEIIKENYKNL